MKQHPYRMSSEGHWVAEKAYAEMLKKGVIRESRSSRPDEPALTEHCGGCPVLSGPGRVRSAAPLHALTKKGAIWQCGREEDEAFEGLIRVLTADMLLV